VAGSEVEPAASSSEENDQEALKRLKDEKFGVVQDSEKAGAIAVSRRDLRLARKVWRESSGPKGSKLTFRLPSRLVLARFAGA